MISFKIFSVHDHIDLLIFLILLIHNPFFNSFGKQFFFNIHYTRFFKFSYLHLNKNKVYKRGKEEKKKNKEERQTKIKQVERKM